MKFKQQSSNPILCKGFTLLELLVAMSVTVILLGMVTFMTGVSLEGYGNSRDKVVTSRDAKQALDAITRDFQAMVARMDGSDSMWLYAGEEPRLDSDKQVVLGFDGPANKKIPNTCQLIFFTSAPDRYDGNLKGNDNKGGDVSAVCYRLVYRDQIADLNPDDNGAHPVFTLYRRIVNPDEVFQGRKSTLGVPDPSKVLLGSSDLKTLWESGTPGGNPPAYVTDDLKAENVLAENIYELTVTFLIAIGTTEGNPFMVRCTISPDLCEDFSIDGNGVKWTGTIELGDTAEIEDTDTIPQVVPGVGDITVDGIEAGQLVGVEISITALSDKGLAMTQKGGMTRADIIKDYGIHYAHSVSVPRF